MARTPNTSNDVSITTMIGRGQSVTSIAKSLGVSDPTVYKAVHRLQLELPGRAQPGVKPGAKRVASRASNAAAATTTAAAVAPAKPSPARRAAPKTAAAKTPVAKTPVAKTPVAKTPVAKTPVAKTPVAKTPAAPAKGAAPTKKAPARTVATKTASKAAAGGSSRARAATRTAAAPASVELVPVAPDQTLLTVRVENGIELLKNLSARIVKHERELASARQRYADTLATLALT